jgi:hypothetical protein
MVFSLNAFPRSVASTASANGAYANASPSATPEDPSLKSPPKNKSKAAQFREDVLESLASFQDSLDAKSTPTYIKWGVPLLIASQIGLLGLLGFMMRESSIIREVNRELKDELKVVRLNLENKMTIQDYAKMGQDLLNGSIDNNPQLKPLVEPVNAIMKSGSIEGLAGLLKSANFIGNLFKPFAQFFNFISRPFAKKY